jgi:hypothetical protein
MTRDPLTDFRTTRPARALISPAVSAQLFAALRGTT